MERDGKTKKSKKRQSLEGRSPLQHLNGLPFQRRNTPSSSSSSAPASSTFLLSATNPSSSRTHLLKKPKTSSEIAKMEPYTPRFKENETLSKPFLQKSTMKKPQFTVQRRNLNSDAKPTCKNRQRSKLSSVHGISESKEEKGFQEFQKKMKKSDDSHILSSDHESAIDDSVYEKTPPVEASLSPEIQFQSLSKMVAPNSVGTPVSYGAGHLLSGVSDNRKSKRRGSLRGGLEKVIPFSDEMRYENVTVDDKQKSSIPLLSEASIRWHLSPCDFGNDLDKDRMEYDDDDDDDLCTIDLLSSLDFLCTKSRCSGSSRVRNNAMFSPRKFSESRGIFDESMLITSPHATYNCNSLSLSRDDFVGSWNSGNFIHTLESGSSSDGEVRLSNSVRQEFDSITETLERVQLSTRSEISMWDAPGLGSHSGDIGPPPISLDPIRLQKDADCVSSWVSDTTSNDPTLSQIRMSWCEGLVREIAGTDEFDCCCCCLSDEQIDGDERVEEKETDHTVVASVLNKENGFRIRNELSPVLLEYEPCLIAEGKEKSFRNNACAESICTDGGGLLASGDSDWTYFQENPLVSCHTEQFKVSFFLYFCYLSWLCN